MRILHGACLNFISFFARRDTPFYLAVALGVLAIAAAFVAGDGLPERAALAARWTARAAFPLFFVAYVASSLQRIWPNTITRSLVIRRRQWGLGFALAHSIHLVALAFNVLNFDNSRPWFVLLGGGVAYGLMYLMAITSNNWSMRKLGKNWKRLHFIGIHYTWFIFFQSYSGRIFEVDPYQKFAGAVFASILLAGLAMRFIVHYGWYKSRKTAS
jgi:methionine sulfoxide reductase heme-binding subunit